MAIKFVLNGQPVSVDLPGDTPLLWVLREGIGLTGTKFGCGVAACGACTIHLAGEPVRSCQTLLDDVAGQSVTTIEGVSGQAAQAVQAAWRELDVVQCGYCQSGQIMSAVGLLSTTPRPTDAEIDDKMGGNVCRCATYPRIRAAIHRAADMMEG
ncbi:MAG: (2Fe-2S)-binding protein [Rhodospirillum sp.]|nr:(2Fe-2S)-binding protein [Rhodospirillum sp.]MCF8492077.1 (2Fe-2S)-binding protein [Rhodospirillum sp.]MCF8500165.1 (2Fe-2S)-binding protein [Rhodospirillum sp.]